MMKVRNSRLGAIAVILLAPCFLTGVAWGQADGLFELGFNAPADVSGDLNEVATVDAECTVSQSNETAKGAQGWSLSMTAENGLISSITTVGTEVDTYFSGGFNKTEVTSGAGNEGAVSAIVLSFTEVRELPPVPGTLYSVAKIQVETAILEDPECLAPLRLLYVDGRAGAGQPVENNITQDGQTVKPTLGEASLCKIIVPSCCGADLAVGFSAEVLASAVPFDEGIANEEADPEAPLCASAGGTIELAPGAATVYANIVSQLEDPPGGAQGWSLSIAYEGDLALTGTTTDGTSVVTYFTGGFNKTEVIDPAKEGNDGQEGVVSAIVLSFTEKRELPLIGTDSVLAIMVDGVLDQAGTLRFQSDLVGAGQPVQNAVTVGGATSDACNFGTAMVNLLVTEPPFGKFIRGNANDDGKVDIADPIWIINELFRGGEPTLCQDAADANNDALVDLSDATFLIGYLFLGGDMPSAPFPECDADPELDDDGVTCEVSQVAGCD